MKIFYLSNIYQPMLIRNDFINFWNKIKFLVNCGTDELFSYPNYPTLINLKTWCPPITLNFFAF